MSQRVYEKPSTQTELCPTDEKIKGIYGPNRSPLGECKMKVEVSELSVVISLDVIMGKVDEDLLIDASMFHNAQIQLRYDRVDLKGKSGCNK